VIHMRYGAGTKRGMRAIQITFASLLFCSLRAFCFILSLLPLRSTNYFGIYLMAYLSYPHVNSISFSGLLQWVARVDRDLPRVAYVRP
jgi:hypothetical protein